MYNILLSSSIKNFIELIGVAFVFVFVLVITYVCTRWIAGYQKQQMKNGNLRIIETISVGNNKNICLVKVGTEYLVVGVGKDEVHSLAVLKEDQLTDFRFQQESENCMINSESFQNVFDKIKEKLPKK